MGLKPESKIFTIIAISLFIAAIVGIGWTVIFSQQSIVSLEIGNNQESIDTKEDSKEANTMDTSIPSIQMQENDSNPLLKKLFPEGNVIYNFRAKVEELIAEADDGNIYKVTLTTWSGPYERVDVPLVVKSEVGALVVGKIKHTYDMGISYESTTNTYIVKEAKDLTTYD